jgi:osmoprotectant transport system permease protein
VSGGRVVIRVAALALLIALTCAPALFKPLFLPLTSNGAPAIYTQGDLRVLTLAHLGIVLLAATASAVVAVPLGIFVTRPIGAEFLPLSRVTADIGQTFPPVAVLALTVPLVGFGETPTFIALFLYGLLPIFENTVAGLTQVPMTVIDAARGVGMNGRQRLFQIELPLALPIILAGIRISAVINMGTATIGSTVAAKGLGEVIIAGLLSDNTAFVLQGGMIVALLAMLLFDGMVALEHLVTRRLGLICETHAGF